MPIRFRLLSGLLASLLLTAAPASSAERRLLTPDDLARLRTVEEPRISPEGAWVAYTVAAPDLKEDRADRDIWMTSWDGRQSLRLTTSRESERMPRWSPDGKSLGFLSSRGDENEVSQLWLLPRAGGEAEKLTELKGGVSDYDWSPDGKRLVLVVEDPDPDAPEPGRDAGAAKRKTRKPIVIDRFQFKQDEAGYLTKKRSHLSLLDLESRRAEMLTSGEFNELMPAWSPDGKWIAFVSKRGEDMDRTENWDVFVIEPRAGATARPLTTFEGADNSPDFESRLAWSPDSQWIAYCQGGPEKLIEYAVRRLAVVPAAGGAARVLTADLDRNVRSPQWSADGSAILFLVEDDRAVHVARIPAAGGPVERLVGGRRAVSSLAVGPGGKIAILSSTPLQPAEVFAVERAEPRRITHQNDSWLSGVRLAAVEETSFASRDGAEIHGFLVRPPDAEGPGRRPPAILRIHGGPVSQFENAFSFEWQLFAASGYAVVAANPRGSSGRGEKFALGIWADWGHKDAEDILAAVDDAVQRGAADPQRLGVGGWSYGGMLTNYTIARDTRFKAAVSGASISNILAGYGTDEYIRDYEAELGQPWKNPDTWVKVSFPFLHADRIKTPTLFLCGESDFNVPLLNSEQMYQALRSLGVPTQLVIYPGQFHGIRKPSYLRDRLERYLAWYAKYLKAENPAAPGSR